jgi:phospholipid/cholesterol/gamma-HCH transport system substrate-binding protein
MRRLAALAAVLVAGVAAFVALRVAGAQGSSTTSFAVIFDDARGLIPGQLVKIAGAQAGTITNVSVVKQGSVFRARVVGTVGSQFMPFHTNATCTIKPQGLIAENFVDCDPGSPPAPPLRPQHGLPPTVPVKNTTEPVSLLDLFNIFNVPTRERVSLLIGELGIGTSGRGQDFNAILYRANPALALARRVIGILARQKAQLGSILDATNTIAQQAATHTGEAQQFIDRAAAVSATTAAHRGALERTIRRLPGLLAAAQPSLQQLDVVARDGTPLLQQLHAAVPWLQRVASDLGPFVAAAKPGLAKLSQALGRAIPAIRETTPLVAALRAYTQRSLPKTRLSGRLFTSLQDSGFLENFLGIIYYVDAALARYDSTSHLLDISLLDIENGRCSLYATKPANGCGANYGSVPATATKVASSKSAAGASASPLSTAKPTALPGPAARAIKPSRQPLPQALSNLMAYLLR